MRTQRSAKAFSIVPPIEPMLAKLADALPATGTFLFEPKWDGFRAIVFRGASDVFIQSRDLRPLDRYFPELHAALLDRLPQGCGIDARIRMKTPKGLHSGGRRGAGPPHRGPQPLPERRPARLYPPVHLTPVTRDRTVAARWLEQFEG